MNMYDLVSMPGYQEIVELIQLFENISVEECADDTRREMAVAFAVSRLRHAPIPDGLRDGLVDRVQKIGFDPMTDWGYDDDGNLDFAYFESNNLGDQADRVLTYRFKKNMKQALLEALSLCKPEAEGKQEMRPAPKLPLLFIADRSIQNELIERWNEAWQCANLGLLLPASVVLGSVLEGALIYFFESVSDQPTRDKYKLPKKVDDWKLYSVVEAVVMEVNFRAGFKELTHQIRLERNYIHPNVSMKSEPLALEGLQTNFAIIGELLARLGSHATKVKP